MSVVPKEQGAGLQHFKSYSEFFKPQYDVAEWFASVAPTLQPYMQALPTFDVRADSVSEFCLAAQVLRVPDDARVGLVLTVWLEGDAGRGGAPVIPSATGTPPPPNRDAARVALAHLVCCAASSAFGDPVARAKATEANDLRFSEPTYDDAPVGRKQKMDREYYQHIATATTGLTGARNAQKAWRKKCGALEFVPFDNTAKIVDYPGLDGEDVPAYTEVIFGRLADPRGLDDGTSARSAAQDALHSLYAVEAELKGILEPFGNAYVGGISLASAPGANVARRRVAVRVGSASVQQDAILYDEDGRRFDKDDPNAYKFAVYADLRGKRESLG